MYFVFPLSLCPSVYLCLCLSHTHSLRHSLTLSALMLKWKKHFSLLPIIPDCPQVASDHIGCSAGWAAGHLERRWTWSPFPACPPVFSRPAGHSPPALRISRCSPAVVNGCRGVTLPTARAYGKHAQGSRRELLPQVQPDFSIQEYSGAFPSAEHSRIPRLLCAAWVSMLSRAHSVALAKGWL